MRKILVGDEVRQRDVTRELLTHKRHVEAMLENMSEGVMELTLAGKIFYANPVAISLTGRKEEQLVGLKFTDLFREPHRRRVRKLLSRADFKAASIGGKSPVRINARDLTLKVSLIKGPDHSSYIVILNDITDQKRLEKATRLQTDYLSALNEISLGLINQVEMQDLLDTIIRHATLLVGTGHGYLFLRDPGELTMEMRVGIGIFQHAQGLQIEPGQGIAGKVWDSGRWMVHNDFHWENGCVPHPDFSAIRSIIGAPVKIGTEVAGVIGLAYLEEGRRFEKDMASILCRLADRAAIALNNARLYEALERELAERRKNQKALQASEERYRNILDAAPDSITITRIQDGRYLQVNEAFCRYTGYSQQEVLGKTPSDLNLFVAPADRDRFIEILKAEGVVNGFETQYRARNGTIIDALLSARPLRYENEDCLVAVVTDITGYKLAEKALQESEQRYRTVLDANPDPVVVYDSGGKVLYFNPAFTRVFGWTLAERRGKTMDLFVPRENRPETRMMIQKVLAGERFSGIETFRYTKDGEIIPVSISGAIFRDQNNRPRGTVVTLRDITEQKKLQAQLQHAQKMESIGTLTSGVAHNFRNILTGISINSQLLHMKFGDIPELVKIQKRTDRYVKRGTRLIAELMQFSHRRPSAHGPVDLAAVIRESYQLIRESFDQKIDIQMDIPETLPVVGDHAALSQVLINLCTNARDAMPDGGQLIIEAKTIDGQAVVTVSDTGQGMGPETREKCFDPFFTTKTVDRGTGLGLSTTYGIVKDHGGEIHVYSEPGRGTTFRFRLPLIESGKPEEKDKGAVLVPGNGEKILLVDDETELLESMEELLEGIGYRTAAVAGGDTALDTYKSWRPDVLLLDRNMPGLDGVSCAKRVIAFDPTARIILISGYEQLGANGIDQDTQSLIKGYLTKPIDMVELSRVLRRLLDAS